MTTSAPRPIPADADRCSAVLTPRGRWDWGANRRCTRARVGDTDLCGVHATVARKQAASREASDARMNESRTGRARADAAVAKLARLGIRATANYETQRGGMGRFDGRVVIDPDVLFARIEEGLEADYYSLAIESAIDDDA